MYVRTYIESTYHTGLGHVALTQPPAGDMRAPYLMWSPPLLLLSCSLRDESRIRRLTTILQRASSPHVLRLCTRKRAACIIDVFLLRTHPHSIIRTSLQIHPRGCYQYARPQPISKFILILLLELVKFPRGAAISIPLLNLLVNASSFYY